MTLYNAAGETALRVDSPPLDGVVARVAHSLGAGVSVAGGYAAILRERCAGRLDGEGVTALAGVEGGIGRLRLVVDDLLDLVAVGTAPFARERVPLASVASRAVAGLRPAIARADVWVHVGELPELVADAALMERLFHHLLREAVGAIDPGPGRIDISAAQEPDGLLLRVDDTGVWFDDDAAREMLMSGGSRAGGASAGAGLSMVICRGIVERHGGSIEVGGDAGMGGRVALFLPVAS